MTDQEAQIALPESRIVPIGMSFFAWQLFFAYSGYTNPIGMLYHVCALEMHLVFNKLSTFR